MITALAGRQGCLFSGTGALAATFAAANRIRSIFTRAIRLPQAGVGFTIGKSQGHTSDVSRGTATTRPNQPRPTHLGFKSITGHHVGCAAVEQTTLGPNGNTGIGFGDEDEGWVYSVHQFDSGKAVRQVVAAVDAVVTT